MVYLGAGVLLASLAAVFFFRAKADGREHPLVAGSLVSAVFPTILLGFIAFGIAMLVFGFSRP